MSLPTRIYLTGFMASGKSTLGPHLARIIGYEFVDLDERIEAALGCTIAQCFETHGEARFREIETEQLGEVSRRPRTVVALGGGALLNPSNFRVARQSGLVVYLKWPASRLLERLQHSHARPLLWSEDGTLLSTAELEARIERILREREPVYLESDVVVKLNRHEITKAVESILSAIRRHVYGFDSPRT